MYAFYSFSVSIKNKGIKKEDGGGGRTSLR